VTFAQTRFLISTRKMKFDLNRLNPLNGFKKLFSTQGLFEWAKALMKLILIGWVVYAYLRNQIQHLFGLGQLPFKDALSAYTEIAKTLIIRVASAYLILAIADYAYQRWTFMRGLRMSKEEIKEEMKRSEGDPMIKNRIRSQMRRFARMRMMANVPKADVIITNPTHLAIAIRYDPDQMNAPVVLAKGAYLIAERIVATAKEHHIPIIQNIPLAHALYRSVDIDQEIPPELYIAMAEILAHVYSLRGKAATAAVT
ncbi:MAG: EscU/YscU/HrcU family type III secretion system export apparatus switch protein, partial [Anaerolineales bacterium]